MTLSTLRRHPGRSGFTVIEVVLGVAVLAILARMLIAATDSIGAMTEAGNIEAHLARQNESAMRHILADLRRSGFQDDVGAAQWGTSWTYPYTFLEGVATGPFAAHSYAPPPPTAEPGDPDFGPPGSIVLCMPSDLDGNGRPEIDSDADGVPELDGDGDGVATDAPADVSGLWDPARASIDPDVGLVWSRDEVSYVLEVGPTGDRELVRLVGGGAVGRRVVARSVERVVFERVDTPGGDTLMDAVRVQLFFRVTDSEGRLVRTRSEATVQLRNSN